MKITERMTSARLAWLEKLEKASAAGRPRGRAGFDCMQIGWTQWADLEKNSLEQLTDQGRAALKKHREKCSAKGGQP